MGEPKASERYSRSPKLYVKHEFGCRLGSGIEGPERQCRILGHGEPRRIAVDVGRAREHDRLEAVAESFDESNGAQNIDSDGALGGVLGLLAVRKIASQMNEPQRPVRE